MTDSKLKQNIKKILIDGPADLDLMTEKLQTLFDIEKVRAIEAARGDYVEIRIERRGLQE